MAVDVKTIYGTAFASHKTRLGIAMASIKNINGLDATAGGTTALIASVSANDVGDVTTGAIDTTGANWIVISVGNHQSFAGTLSDSKFNTWVPRTQYLNFPVSTQLYDCYNPNVGSGHTFTVAGAVLQGLYVLAFSGIASSPFDGESGDTVASGTTAQPGSITPSQSNVLFVTAITNRDQLLTYSINSGFTALSTMQGNYDWCWCVAYKVSNSGAAENPTWTLSASPPGVVPAMAAYKL